MALYESVSSGEIKLANCMFPADALELLRSRGVMQPHSTVITTLVHIGPHRPTSPGPALTQLCFTTQVDGRRNIQHALHKTFHAIDGGNIRERLCGRSAYGKVVDQEVCTKCGDTQEILGTTRWWGTAHI